MEESCFPLLDIFRRAISTGQDRHFSLSSSSSAFVYCASWEDTTMGAEKEDSEVMTAQTSTEISVSSDETHSTTSSSEGQHGTRRPQQYYDLMSTMSKTHYPEFQHCGFVEDFEFEDGEEDSLNHTVDDDDEEEYETEEEEEEEEEQYFDEAHDDDFKITTVTTPENEDAAVFSKIMEYMPPESVFHLLQGQVSPAVESKGSSQGLSRNDPSMPRPKSFRWAEVTGNQVRVIVHKIESYKKYKDDLWWSKEDVNERNKSIFEVIGYYQFHQSQFIESTETLLRQAAAAESTEKLLRQQQHQVVEAEAVAAEDHGCSNCPPSLVVEDCMTKVVGSFRSSSFSPPLRGLECHTIKFFSQRRKKHVRSILNKQVACTSKSRWGGSSSNDNDRCDTVLRDHSIKSSKLLSMYARRIGEYDEIESLMFDGKQCQLKI